MALFVAVKPKLCKLRANFTKLCEKNYEKGQKCLN